MQRGFTLIELLIAIGIIALLSAIIMGALSPARQYAASRDAKRRADVHIIVNAINQYSIDAGSLPAGIPLEPDAAVEICATGAMSCAGLLDLSVLVPTYFGSIPRDPRVADADNGTRYVVLRSTNGRVTVSAPDAENEAISVTR